MKDLSKFKTIVTQEDIVEDLGVSPDSTGKEIKLEETDKTPPPIYNQFVGFKCIPKNWESQKNRFKRAGLMDAFNNRKVLTVSRSQRVNLGRGYSNEIFLWFEGMTKGEYFFARYFKIVEDNAGNKY